VVEALATAGPEGDAEVEAKVLAEVHALCAAFPIYAGSAR
jgi:glycine hydroxymethyltransferase